MSIRILFFCIFLFLFSCSDKRDFELYINDLGIEFVDKYKIDSIEQYGLTDWTSKSAIQVSENDKIRILNKLKAKTRFIKVNSTNEYFEKYVPKNSFEFGYINKSKYYYGIEIKREKYGYKSYDIEIDTVTNKLFFEYNYE